MSPLASCNSKSTFLTSDSCPLIMSHINYATCQNSFAHQPTPQKIPIPIPTHLSPHPKTSIHTSWADPQTYQHIPQPSPPPCLHPHTQKWLPWKNTIFPFFKKTKKTKTKTKTLIQSNSLCPCIWIGTKSGLNAFEKTLRFSSYPFWFFIRRIFLSLSLYVKTVILNCLTI